jgi:hypothetical protein
MTLIELKNAITSGNIPTDFLIFVDKDNKFLAKQYVQAIRAAMPNGITKIKSVYEPCQSSLALLTTQEDTINILFVDTFAERSEDYSQFENTIVVCEQVDKSIAKVVEPFIIKFPKFEEWQIYDYIKMLCPAIEEADLMWLIKATNCEPERIINEIDKVALFSTAEEQKAIFAAIRFDPQTDLYKPELFAIVDALVDGNMQALFTFLKCDDCNSLEPVVLANRTFTSLKNILNATQNTYLSPEDCGMSTGQHRFIRNKYRFLNINAVKQKLKFLTNFDIALKTSKLEMSKHDMLSYLINNLAYKIN